MIVIKRGERGEKDGNQGLFKVVVVRNSNPVSLRRGDG